MSTAVTALTIPQKFDQLEATVNGIVFERRKEIRTAILALISKKHHLQVGPPGIGKTMLVDEIIKLIEGLREHYFRWLMTRFTTPPEIMGAASVKAMAEEDVFRINTANKLPEAFVAFLDEFFKCNSALLNAFLTIMNEGLFFNDGGPVQVPLTTIFAGSNELPKEPELAALWDRVTFRHEVKPMREDGNFETMLRNRATRHLRTIALDPVITWDEILIAQDMAAQVEIPDEVYGKMVELRKNLKREGIEPTERRHNDAIPIIQASAYWDGRSVADVVDMQDLRHIYWMDLKDQPVVDRLVLEIANPIDKEALELLDTVEKLTAEVNTLLGSNADNKQAQRRQAVSLNGKLDRCGEELDALYEKAKASPRRSEIVDEARQSLKSVVNRMLGELYGHKGD